MAVTVKSRFGKWQDFGFVPADEMGFRRDHLQQGKDRAGRAEPRGVVVAADDDGRDAGLLQSPELAHGRADGCIGRPGLIEEVTGMDDEIDVALAECRRWRRRRRFRRRSSAGCDRSGDRFCRARGSRDGCRKCARCGSVSRVRVPAFRAISALKKLRRSKPWASTPGDWTGLRARDIRVAEKGNHREVPLLCAVIPSEAEGPPGRSEVAGRPGTWKKSGASQPRELACFAWRIWFWISVQGVMRRAAEVSRILFQCCSTPRADLLHLCIGESRRFGAHVALG